MDEIRYWHGVACHVRKCRHRATARLCTLIRNSGGVVASVRSVR